MDSVPAPVLALLDQHKATIHAAWRIETADPMTPSLIWSGFWDQEIDLTGEVYKGLGATNLNAPIAYTIGGSADGISVALSSEDPTFVPIVLGEDLRGRTADLFRLIFDEHGTTLLWTQRIAIGAVDQVQVMETIGGDATVVFKVETEAAGSQRTGGTLAADQHQRRVDPADRAFEYITISPDLTLYWGVKDPGRAGKVANGGSTGQSDRR